MSSGNDDLMLLIEHPAPTRHTNPERKRVKWAGECIDGDRDDEKARQLDSSAEDSDSAVHQVLMQSSSTALY